MQKKKLNSEKIYIILMLLVTGCTFSLLVLNSYIFPKIAIYKVSRHNPNFKIACVQDYKQPSFRHAKSYWIIDNKSYYDKDVSIYSATSLTIKHRFPVDNSKELVNAIKNKKRNCYFVSYIEVFNLGFVKRFYLYQYIKD